MLLPNDHEGITPGEIKIEPPKTPVDALGKVLDLIRNSIRYIQSVDYDRKVKTVKISWEKIGEDVLPVVSIDMENKWFKKKPSDKETY
jgi:hypothetical protein